MRFPLPAHADVTYTRTTHPAVARLGVEVDPEGQYAKAIDTKGRSWVVKLCGNGLAVRELVLRGD